MADWSTYAVVATILGVWSVPWGKVVFVFLGERVRPVLIGINDADPGFPERVVLWALLCEVEAAVVLV